MMERRTFGQRIARLMRPSRPRQRSLSARLERAPEIDVNIRAGRVSFYRSPPGTDEVEVRAEIRSHEAATAASTSLGIVRSGSSVRIECVGIHISDPVTTVSCDIDVWVPDGVLCRARVSIGAIPCVSRYDLT